MSQNDHPLLPNHRTTIPLVAAVQTAMNRNTPEKTNTRPPNEADKFLEMLYARGMISVISDREKCKMKLVKLGLPVPDRNTDCLLYCSEGPDTAYFFACVRDWKHGVQRRAFVGFVFDVAMYRSQPLPGIPDLPQALRFFAIAVAQLEGLDLRKSTFTVQRPSLN